MLVTIDYRTHTGSEGIITVPFSKPDQILHYLSGFLADVTVKSVKVMG